MHKVFFSTHSLSFLAQLKAFWMSRVTGRTVMRELWLWTTIIHYGIIIPGLSWLYLESKGCFWCLPRRGGLKWRCPLYWLFGPGTKKIYNLVFWLRVCFVQTQNKESAPLCDCHPTISCHRYVTQSLIYKSETGPSAVALVVHYPSP